MQLFNIQQSTGGTQYSELYLEFKEQKSHVVPFCFFLKNGSSVLSFIPNATVYLFPLPNGETD